MKHNADGEIADCCQTEAGAGYEAICSRFFRAVRAETAILPDNMRKAIEATSAFANRDWERLHQMAAEVPEGGLSAEELAEICLQTAIYTGIASLARALATIRAGLDDTGRTLNFTPGPDANIELLALDLRKSLHSDRHTQGHADESRFFSGPLYTIISRIGYGEIWSRPALSLKLRLCCALAGMTIASPPELLCKFARTSLDNGYTKELLRAVLVETVLYHGGPRTLFALMAVEDNLELPT